MMSSREIAALTQKRHDNVLRDINKMIDQRVINALNFEPVHYVDGKGEQRPAWNLDYEATMCLVTGYDAHRRMAVIKR